MNQRFGPHGPEEANFHQAFLAAIVESSDDAIIGQTLDGIIISWNQGAERLYGYTAEEAIGQSISLLAPPDRADEIPVILDRIRLGGRVDHLDTERIGKEGKRVHVSLTVSPVFSSSGTIIGVSTIAHDVTERLQALQTLERLAMESTQQASALRASEERYRALFERAPIGIELADQDGNLIDTNAAFQKMVGYTAGELQGIPFESVSHPDDVAAELALDLELDAGLRGHYQLVKRFVRKDGGIVWGRLTASDVGRIGDGTFQFAIGMVEDITEQKRAEDAFEASEERYRLLVERSPDMIALLDLDLTVVMANSRAAELCGYESPAVMTGMDAYEILTPEEQADIGKTIEGLLRDGGARDQRYKVRRRDGTTFAAEVSTSLITGLNGQPTGIMVIGRDISERLQLEKELQYRALYDALTGLPNRGLVQDRLEQALQTARRDQSSLALLLLDLNHFKDINDTFGHEFGDILLQQIGPRLQATLRASDSIGRLGGDEFAIVLPHTSERGAVGVARRVAELLGQPFTVEGYSLDVMGSIGIALFPVHGEDVTTLFRHADIAMYVAKGTHTGYMVYAVEHDRHSPERLELIRDLRRAIHQGELSLHYQPKVDMKTGRLHSVEALVRWYHPSRGMIPPGDFIPLAEATGLIKNITSFVVAEARRQYETWREADFDIPVSLNLSTQDLQDDELVKLMAHIFRRGHFNPGALQVEITERGLIEDGDHVQVVLARLHDLGVRIAIDDFGTGYSQLGYLKQLPVDEIKIDRSFVSDMVNNSQDQAIVQSVIDLGHNLGLQVTAEGVENGPTWDILERMGCDVLQGYYMSRPLPAQELLQWLRAWERPASKAS